MGVLRGRKIRQMGDLILLLWCSCTGINTVMRHTRMRFKSWREDGTTTSISE